MAREAKPVPCPDDPSSDFCAMEPYWAMVRTILAGVDAMRCAGETYLPKFVKETVANYAYRLGNAPFTNIFRDIVENLAAKPFAKEITLNEGASETIKTICEDIDGRGNNLNVFAGQTFFNGIANAIDWIMVDYPKVEPAATVAEEKKVGARPYWVAIPADHMLAVYSDIINGKEEIVHARIYEPVTERDGYCEVEKIRVRVLSRIVLGEDFRGKTIYGGAVWELFEQKEQRSKSGKVKRLVWELVDSGELTIGIIPLVPFITGQRKCGSWKIRPPMKDAADLQIEHYQAETNLKAAKEMTAFPMLAGNGVTPPTGKDGQPEQITIGPGAVLYAPPDEAGNHGEWQFIEPGAQSLTFLAADLKEIGQRLRELGRQPLTAQTGNLTVVTTAFAAQKGNSAAQKWAHGLKDALEQALKITELWLTTKQEPTVTIFTDFGIDDQDGKSMDQVLSMRKNRDLDQQTTWDEARRRNILSADFDPEKVKAALREEGPDPEDEELAGAPPRPRLAA